MVKQQNSKALSFQSMPGLDSRYTRLTFVPARYATERPTNHLESNIVLLDSETPGDSKMGRKKGIRSQGPRTRSQKELFPADELSMEWSQVRRVGSGLTNLGNTCFMNSVLQCLIHTPPLAELLLSGRNVTYTPCKSLKRINRWFKLGRQEDAHEYLIALLDAMHDRSISGMNPKPSRELEYTSFIYRIFGGKIRSQLKCTQCDYDPILMIPSWICRSKSPEPKPYKRHCSVLPLEKFLMAPIVINAQSRILWSRQ
eukprot:jgi/Picre1/32155/NNA_007501.t1